MSWDHCSIPALAQAFGCQAESCMLCHLAVLRFCVLEKEKFVFKFTVMVLLDVFFVVGLSGRFNVFGIDCVVLFRCLFDVPVKYTEPYYKPF